MMNPHPIFKIFFLTILLNAPIHSMKASLLELPSYIWEGILFNLAENEQENTLKSLFCTNKHLYSRMKETVPGKELLTILKGKHILQLGKKFSKKIAQQKFEEWLKKEGNCDNYYKTLEDRLQKYPSIDYVPYWFIARALKLTQEPLIITGQEAITNPFHLLMQAIHPRRGWVTFNHSQGYVYSLKKVPKLVELADLKKKSKNITKNIQGNWYVFSNNRGNFLVKKSWFLANEYYFIIALSTFLFKIPNLIENAELTYVENGNRICFCIPLSIKELLEKAFKF